MKTLTGMILAGFCIMASANDFDSCFDKGMQAGDFSKIVDKVSLEGVHKYTFEMLSNRARPNAAEKKQLAVWAKLHETCRAEAPFSSNSDYSPELVRMLNRHLTQLVAALAKLHAGQIAYGEFGQRHQELAMELARDFTALEAQIALQQKEQQKQVAQEAAARWEEARRQEQLVAQQAQMEQQINIEQARMVGDIFRRNRPATAVNCTSTNSFGVVNTTCR